ncbi:hypothetical protein LWI29_015029 [Acer saccharum]|uniref:RNase H type-1 domain-containing protein n=1 Tax=Acer saccharum TaxID=4024 RepID=A0AA39RLG1_ACESA|nr:hypothetical protein LWI29_015029 [Acer saccharum]
MASITDTGKHRVGIGIVIHDGSSFVMASCCQILEATYDSLVVGIMAIFRGILFSKDYGLAPCVLEPDKVEAVDRVLNNNLLNASHGSILSKIADLSSQINGMNISAISTSANRVAQKLAKNALDTSKNTFWVEDFPNCIRGLVETDRSF